LPGTRRTSSIVGAVPRTLIKSLQTLPANVVGNCLPSEIKTNLKADNLHQAAIYADDYALTHKGSFKKPYPHIGTLIEYFQQEIKD